LPRTPEEVRERLDFLAETAASVLLALFEDFRFDGVLMMLRTAAKRSELTPRILAISSGVGTGFLITYTPIGAL
jgi:hypothetical protein